jgi:hypothetical protein
MNENRRLRKIHNPSSPSLDGNLPAGAGAGRGPAAILLSALRAVAGVLLTTLGIATGIVGGAVAKNMCHALGKGIPTARTLAYLVGGFLTLGVGLLIFAVGMLLLGREGKARLVGFGSLLFFGGLAVYFGNLIVTHGESRLVTLFSLLAAALGLVVIAASKGWLGKASIFDE